MVPLTTRQGLSAAEIAGLVDGREVAIWGVGDLALDVLTSLRKAGINPTACLHSAAAAGGQAHGLPVRAVAQVLASGEGASLPFIVLATAAFRSQAERLCLDAGLRKDRDFISHLAIPRPQAIVEVAGDCRLRCVGCPRSTNDSAPSATLMEAATFSRVLAKLAADLPLLSHLELALWGEPLLNPELPEIIRQVEAVVPCTVATSLAGDAPLAPVVGAGPSRFDITAFGFGESYERAMGGASWPELLRRLAHLRELIGRLRPRTRFQVKLYRLKDDPPGLEQEWRQLLQGSGIALSPQTPYLMPYDHVLSYCETGTLPAAARSSAASLTWELDGVLAACAGDASLPCLSQRVFPVIHADRSVALCHLYDRPAVADDYLDIGWQELLDRRHAAEHCRRCQNHGLHRLDIDVLARRHPDRFSGNPQEKMHEQR